MKKKYMVYTNIGDYAVYAYDTEDAKRVVMRLTYGRAKIDCVTKGGF